MTDEIGLWSYFPRTNYRSVAANLDTLTSAAFTVNAAATDKFLNEFWNSPDGAVVLRTPYTIVIRRCIYLGNAKRKLDRKLVERLVETYRELSGLYEKGLRLAIGIMDILEGREVTYAQVARWPLASNVKHASTTYPWFTNDFEIIIRNSVAHVNYEVSYITKSMLFRDNRAAVKVTFREMFTRCRLLSSLVVALLLLNVFFYYWRWKAISENYDRMKDLAKSDKRT
jgi:hypothetical protein